ncbi:tetraacyldisaccharide 4'-kinase [bacterium]|nr:MAG: tetraacyldisaccharide 4'-kinase [bacterium]
MDAREIWESGEIGACAARTALTPLSWLYAGGWSVYRALYDLGIKRAFEPAIPTICIGNLTVGGMGKTPVTRYVAESLDRPYVLGLSGYGAPQSEGATLAPDGPLDPAEWGDEPAMFREWLPNAPMVVGRRRPLAAQIVAERFPDHILLMDDGMQHLPLRKHVSILLDPEKPKNGRTLPAGPYREPRWERRRADLILPGEFKIVEAPLAFDHPGGDYALLCALGNPQGFVDAVSRLLRRPPTADRRLPDHDPLTAGTLFDGLPPDLPIVTTEKDWVKLRQRLDIGERDVRVAVRKVRIEPEAEFRGWLAERLDGVQTKSHP